MTQTIEEPKTTNAEAVSLPPLFADLPEVFRPHWQADAPWALLGDPLDEVLAALPEDGIEIRLGPDVHLSGAPVAIGRGSRIGPGATIDGPVFIGRDVEIRPGAYLRGGCWIGDGAVVGASTECKRAILLPGAHAPHLNYVGDSILGSGVNLGAGTILSNFRHDGREIDIRHGDRRLPTGRRKLGAILGDGVLTGCNAVLHPGVVVGRNTQIYPGVQLRNGVYAADRVVKLRQEIEVVELEG